MITLSIKIEKKPFKIWTILVYSFIIDWLFSSNSIIVDSTGMDFQNYWYTGSFGQQILVDESGVVHAVYCKTWCTENDTGYQVQYANITEDLKVPVPSLQSQKEIQPGVIYVDGGYYGTPVYFYYGVGSRFYSYTNSNMHLQAVAKLGNDNKEIIPVGLQASFNGYSDPVWLTNPIDIETDNINGLIHCIFTNPSGHTTGYWNFDGTSFSERYFLLDADTINGFYGKYVPEKYRRNGTKGVDIAVSNDGQEITIATLHPACNILLHKGKLRGSLWADNFFEGLNDGSVVALYDTSNSKSGANIPNNDPKPYTEVQISYDEQNNLHVIYDATYIDCYIDTCTTLPWNTWWANYSAMAGDTTAVFYDGSIHPKPQLRYWNSMTKKHCMVAECEFPLSGESYKWYNHAVFDSGAATWGKFINDGPIARIVFFVNNNQKTGEPRLVCCWEEMQGNITNLHDEDKTFTETYYAYMKDIKISFSEDGLTWTKPENITSTPDRDEGEISLFRDIIDENVYLFYLEDGLPGSDLNLFYMDDYEDYYIHNWPAIQGHFSVPIRKSSTEQVYLVHRKISPATGVKIKDFSPGEIMLEQNYPNPFNERTSISFQIKDKCFVNLTVYDLLGHKIIKLVNESTEAGYHRIIWDGSNESGRRVASGIYLYKLTTGEYSIIKKMILQK